MYISELDIIDYMKQFNVDRNIAINEITEVLEEYYQEQEKELYECLYDLYLKNIRG